MSQILLLWWLQGESLGITNQNQFGQGPKESIKEHNEWNKRLTFNLNSNEMISVLGEGKETPVGGRD